MKRLEILITGTVQGVGFRPHVYRIAQSLTLTGWVKNTTAGVLIEIQGNLVSCFLPTLQASLPSLASIETIQTKQIASIPNESTFTIMASEQGQGRTIISPDVAICCDCLYELFNPQNRYFAYPFLNCTQCGPRLSITHKLPYDRQYTSMNLFPLCSCCQEDYLDPTNRRYHAQPTACQRCGPQLSATVAEMKNAVREGKILAVKGTGGYQLICDARNEKAIDQLRKRKIREAKPFALMVVNLQSAESLVELNEPARYWLINKARPILLLPQKDYSLPTSIAPGLSELGVMLPSTPLHYLLFHALAGYPQGYDWLETYQPTVLIVTSANVSGNPLIGDDSKAVDELAQVADRIVAYNRQIVTRVDDSVIRLVHNTPLFIRRARGFVPEGIKLPRAIPPTLALGGQLKNTFCITRGDEAFVSQYIGSLNNKETIEFFHESLNHLQDFLQVTIERVAYDAHPDFYTTRLAESYDLPHVAVQHHHAHMASVAAEHHVLSKALGLVLDGHGHGVDGGSWGGELLLLEGTQCQRLGSFYPLPFPGGDRAACEPWRMAASVLYVLGQQEDILRRFAEIPQAVPLLHWLTASTNIAVTSSCGRWFDAASALLGINWFSHYESQAARQLESLVTRPEILAKGWFFDEKHFNMLPVFAKLLTLDPVAGANLFHGTLIAGLTDWVLSWAKKIAIKTVLLSGGCFLNKILAEGLSERLLQRGLTVHLPQRLPPNDSGLSLGQAWIAGQKTFV